MERLKNLERQMELSRAQQSPTPMTHASTDAGNRPDINSEMRIASRWHSRAISNLPNEVANNVSEALNYFKQKEQMQI